MTTLLITHREKVRYQLTGKRDPRSYRVGGYVHTVERVKGKHPARKPKAKK